MKAHVHITAYTLFSDPGVKDTTLSSSRTSELGSWRDRELDYRKMIRLSEEKGFSIVEVAMDGDCALHAAIRQLQQQGDSSYDVRMLRRLAVEQLESYPQLVNLDMINRCYGGNFRAYLTQQAVQGTLCDEAMLHAVCAVTRRDVHLFRDDGDVTKFESRQFLSGKLITIGLIAGLHYVSLEPRDTSINKHPTTSAAELPTVTSGASGSSAAGDKYEAGKQEQSATGGQEAARRYSYSRLLKSDAERRGSSVVDVLQTSDSALDANAGSDESPTAAADDTCAICMDVIKDPKTLPCAHVFCSKCIEQSLEYQPKCPCCGKILGLLRGDQPEGGTMTVRRDQWPDLEGYPGCGCIIIDYSIPSGRQKV